MSARVWAMIGFEFLVFAALLFGGAGTLGWIAGWAYLGLFFGIAVPITVSLARHDPALLRERMKPLIQPGQPLWDKILMPAFLVAYLGWMVLMPLDAVRFRWSRMPVWLEAAGAAGVALGMWICYLAFRENTFLAPVVRIQSERGQRVISSGPYRVVRHPMYAGALVLLPSSALMLGSWYGLAGSALLIAGLVTRTTLEDRELRQGLPGYQAYAGRVRWRLIPGIW
jgi:protein-S-isoprenylcysteine O-methyltransferase Ste14